MLYYNTDKKLENKKIPAKLFTKICKRPLAAQAKQKHDLSAYTDHIYIQGLLKLECIKEHMDQGNEKWST